MKMPRLRLAFGPGRLHAVMVAGWVASRNRVLFASTLSIIVAFVVAAPMTLRAQTTAQNVAGDNVLDRIHADHITVSVENLETERDWYVRVFGAKMITKIVNPDSEVWRMKIPGYGIDLLKQKHSKKPLVVNPPALRQGWLHVVFSLPPAEIEQAMKVLQSRGTDVKPSTRAVTANQMHKGEIWLLTLHDAEGNEIEIVAAEN